jgi:thioredoxin reductase
VSDRTYDVVIVGGGPAGLSAALVLGRVRRSVLVLDTDEPANAVSEGVHGFLSRDGTPPTELRAVAREQLLPYDSVEFKPLAAESVAHGADGGFEVTLAGGEKVGARRLLLAHGMRYELPPLAGVADLWGSRVFHCPYCHGWEVRDRALAALGSGERSWHQALLLSSLSSDCVLVAGADCELDDDQRAALVRAGVGLDERTPREVRATENGIAIHFDEGQLERDALFVKPEIVLPNDFATSLGAELTEGGTILTAPNDTTTVPGLFAAGDPAEFVQSVALATASGQRAAYAINAELAADSAT